MTTREARGYLRLRLEYLRRGDGAGESPQPRCSVLVECVPPRLRSSGALRAYFAALFGDAEVHSAVSFVDATSLAKLIDARDAAADAYAWRAARKPRSGYDAVGDAALASLSRRLERAEAAVAAAQRDVRGAAARRAAETLEDSGLISLAGEASDESIGDAAKRAPPERDGSSAGAL